MKKLIYILVILLQSCYTINIYDFEQVKSLEVKLPKTENCQYCGYDKHENSFSYDDGCNSVTCHNNGTFSTTLVFCSENKIDPKLVSKESFDRLFPKGIQFEIQQKDFTLLNK